MLWHDAAAHESKVRDGLLNLRSRGLGDAFGWLRTLDTVPVETPARRATSTSFALW